MVPGVGLVGSYGVAVSPSVRFNLEFGFQGVRAGQLVATAETCALTSVLRVALALTFWLRAQ